ncbi:MAG: diacylglycerol kinase family protein [bacterium]
MSSKLRTLLRSFAFAFSGVLTLVQSQANARIHLFFTVAVPLAGYYCGLTRIEWCLLVVAIILVWATEALNTAVEHLADASSPQPHPLVGKAKDLAAGAVLIAAVGSVIIGLLIFGPRILQVLIHFAAKPLSDS